MSIENDAKRLSKLEYLLLLFSMLEQKKGNKSESVFEEVLKKNQFKRLEFQITEKKKTTFTSIDAQSVKNTDIAKNKGYDTGKKVSGIKRHS